MKEVQVSKVIETVKNLCIEANYHLSGDIKRRFEEARSKETFDVAKNIIGILMENADIASSERMPMCQDTGMAVVFLEIGQDVHVVGGSLEEAVNEGVRQGYEEGFLRKSVVGDPLERVNTKDNTPAIIHLSLIHI